MTRLHRPATTRGILPLHLATTGDDQPTYRDHIATLTLHHTDQRCHGCPWPDTCAQDRTCWQQETAHHSQWQRTRLDLPRSPNAGINTWTRDHAIQAAQAFRQRTGRSPSLADCSAQDLPPTSAIYRLFGSPWAWHDAAGIPRTKRGRQGRKPQPQLEIPQPEV